MGPSRRLLLNQSTRLRVAYFQILNIASRALAVNQLGFVKTVYGLRESVVI